MSFRNTAFATVFSIVLVGCGGGGGDDFVDPRSATSTETTAAGARENVAGLLDSVQDMIRSGEMGSLGEFCDEMTPTFEGYAADDESVYKDAYDSMLTQWQELVAAAKAADKSKVEAAVKSLRATLEQLPG